MIKNINKNIFVAAVVGCLVLCNLLSVRYFARFDLTHDKIFTLSEATKRTISSLEDPVTITAYFSEDLPPQVASIERYVQDLLEEYRAASGNKISYSFVDPAQVSADEKSADKTDTSQEVKRNIFGQVIREQSAIEKDLAALGIQPVEIREFQEDQAKTKRAYLGVALSYRDKKEAIPVVNTTEGLEYDLTMTLRRLIRSKTPVVGFLQGHGEPSTQEMQRASQLLQGNYEFRPATLGEDGKIADDIDTLFVIGPKTGLDEITLQAIDAFIMSGKNAAFFVDVAQMDLRTFNPTAVTHGLDNLLETYGLEVGTRLIGDVNCATIGISEQRGNMRFSVPTPYPFIPQVKNLPQDDVVTRGVSDVTFPFAVPLYEQKIDGVTFKALAMSSNKSWLDDAVPEKINPRNDWNSADISLSGPYTLAASLSGILPSYANAGSKSSKDVRLVVVGTSTFLNDAVMSPNNSLFFLNTVDWLLLDPAVLALRSRSSHEANIDETLTENGRAAVKFGNLIGAPLILLMVGIYYWQQRRVRRISPLANLSVSSPSSGGQA